MVRLYLDCDGVLADFDKGFIQEFGMTSSEYEDKFGSQTFWTDIRLCKGFFQHLPLMEDALELFDFAKQYRPIILTGCPAGDWPHVQKLKWRDRHFPGVPMITCRAKEKKLYCAAGDILVDDILTYKHLWEESGGVYVHHTSAANSIAKLKELL